MKRIAILGSTGSIGQNALELIDLHPDRFKVVALAAGSNAQSLAEQCSKYQPLMAALYDPEAADQLSALRPRTRVSVGIEGLIEASTLPEADIVISAISGSGGLIPTFQALAQGKKVALANKETLVMAGDLIMSMVRKGQGSILPVDSEHSALQQCLAGSSAKEVKRLILTASGGPFLNFSTEQLREVTVEQALRHPTWEMGPKITVDSATLMNKGLEVIEASHLFQTPAENIDVVIHPQSTVHSIVEFIDGTMLAQLGITDMKVPLLNALTFPERIESKLPRLDITELANIEFHKPDLLRFPCLNAAYRALLAGGTAPTILNGANETAVEAFLARKLTFTGIPAVIERVLDSLPSSPADNLDSIIDADRSSRNLAMEIIREIIS